MKLTGPLSKMLSHHQQPISYQLLLGKVPFDLNSALGKRIKFTFSGNIFCDHCGKKTKKSYAQGHCFPCSIKLAACDMCILKPETCHYYQGTCREPAWGEEHCLKPHIVYLANSSGLKVGITRKSQVPFRWIDQGASQALPIMEVKDRLTSGKVEVLFKQHIADKTDWRKMLKGPAESIDLQAARDRLLGELRTELAGLEYKLTDPHEYNFDYPVKNYPQKIVSLGLDKNVEIDSVLLGVKGQYLIFEAGVINIRSHTGYEVTMEISDAIEST